MTHTFARAADRLHHCVTMPLKAVVACALGGIVVLFAPAWISRGSMQPDLSLGAVAPADPTLHFAYLICAGCLAVTVLVLLAALPVYLFAKDAQRSSRAGTVVKVALRFVVTSGTGVLAYLGFVSG